VKRRRQGERKERIEVSSTQWSVAFRVCCAMKSKIEKY
jgi:hypothetical protein